MLDTSIVSEKVVTYQFNIKAGDTQYTSRYTPEPEDQPGNLPHAWWQGTSLVGIRVKKHTLYLRMPEGGEIATHIVSQTITAK